MVSCAKQVNLNQFMYTILNSQNGTKI